MKIRNLYLLLSSIFFMALTFISCDKDDDRVELPKEKLMNYCDLNIDGGTYLLKDSFHLDMLRGLGQTTYPQIFQVFGDDRKLKFEWEIIDRYQDTGAFPITSGEFIDETKGINSQHLEGTLNIDTFKLYYSSDLEVQDPRMALLVGRYTIQVILPNNSKKYINGKFRYDGEYESKF